MVLESSTSLCVLPYFKTHIHTYTHNSNRHVKLHVNSTTNIDTRRICRAFDSSAFLRRIGVDENMGGVAFVLGHIAGYVMRPNVALQLLISQIEAEIDLKSWNHRSIGVHLRLGDKRFELKKSEIPHNILNYFEQIQRLSFIHGYRDVFIASDLANASLTLRRLLEAENFRVHQVPERYFEIINHDDPLLNHASYLKDLEFRLGETSPYDEGLTLLAQAWMLSKCDALLGSFTSNYFQLVYELSHVHFTSRRRVLVEDIDRLPYFPCSPWNQVPWGRQNL